MIGRLAAAFAILLTYGALVYIVAQWHRVPATVIAVLLALPAGFLVLFVLLWTPS